MGETKLEELEVGVVAEPMQCWDRRLGLAWLKRGEPGEGWGEADWMLVGAEPH